MKFKPLLTVTMLVAALVFPFGEGAAKKKKNEPVEAEPQEEVIVVEEVVEISEEPDITNSYHRATRTDSVLRVAVVLADMNSNRDNEFSRGFLMGLQNTPIPDGSLALKMINGQIPLDSLNRVLTEFNPNVIFTTSDKETPKPLLDYAQSNFTKLVSVFDAKGEDYKKYPGLYQLLSPSAQFNSATARYFTDSYGDNILLLVGEPDGNDVIMRDMIIDWPEGQLKLIDPQELPGYTFEEGLNYLIYPVLASDKDMPAFMTEVQKKVDAYPLSGIRVVGRPNWITISDLDKKIGKVETLIPAKCYFDKNEDAAKRFIIDYKNKYGQTPMVSYPVFAVMGNDAAKYLIPTMIGEIRGTIGEWPAENMLQSYFDFSDEGWGQGSYNKGTYVLHYIPGQKMQKDLVH